MKKLRLYVLAFKCLCTCTGLVAQSYTLTDHKAAYTHISGTTLTDELNTVVKYDIALNFSFEYFGVKYNKISVSGDGNIYLGKAYLFNIGARLKGLKGTELRYTRSFANGAQSITIEWYKAGFLDDVNSVHHVDFKVTLSERGTIFLHYGANTGTIPPKLFYNNRGPIIYLRNEYGNISYSVEPQYQLVKGYTQNLYALPDSGTVLEFRNVLPVPTLRILYPNGASLWTQGYKEIISWISAGINNVKIERSVDGGLTYTLVDSAYPAAQGYMEYMVPVEYQTHNRTLLRISSTAQPSIKTSNAIYFVSRYIEPEITLKYPLGGEVFIADGIVPIQWNMQDVDNVKLWYSTDNEKTWKLITAQTNKGDTSYDWKVPADFSPFVKVRVQDVFDTTVDARSPGYFNIVEKGRSIAFTRTDPGSPEYLWAFGNDTFHIRWNNYFVEEVNLYYSTDSGQNWTRIGYKDMPARDEVYFWTVPEITSDKCLFKIEDAEYPFIYDISNLFAIRAEKPLLKLITPKAKDRYVRASANQQIDWESKDVDSITIYFTSDNWANSMVIRDGAKAALKSLLWTMPDLSSRLCAIEIVDKANPYRVRSSSGLFEILDEEIGIAEEYRNAAQIKVFPNPSSGAFNVEVTEPFNGECILMNSQGQVLWRKQSTLNAGSKLPVADDMSLPKGLYFLSLWSLDSNQVIKVAIE